MDKISSKLLKYNVAHKLYKKSLLNAVCAVAGISIFFFGYDQVEAACLTTLAELFLMSTRVLWAV